MTVLSIDFDARIAALLTHLTTHYSYADKHTVEIILASQLPLKECGRALFPWLALETAWGSVDCTRAWFSFGGLITPQSLSQIRLMRPRNAHNQIAEWLSELGKRPMLLVESEYRKATKVHMNCRAYPALQSQLLRVWTKNPKNGMAVGERPESVEQELRYLADRVIGKGAEGLRVGSTLNAPLKAPGSLLYWCEVLQKLNPAMRDWDALTRNIRNLVVRRAELYNRAVEHQDWLAMGRVMADCVPYYVSEIIKLVAVNKDPTTRQRMERVTGLDENMIKWTVEFLKDVRVLMSVARGYKVTHSDYSTLVKGECFNITKKE